tara:strand:- start:176 stop:346 length:171 start_codon:yes stop_codon:yes gene_type:complete
MKAEELREIWTDMFTAIDDFVEKVHIKYPEISHLIDRETIKKAVQATAKYDKEINK